MIANLHNMSWCWCVLLVMLGLCHLHHCMPTRNDWTQGIDNDDNDGLSEASWEIASESLPFLSSSYNLQSSNNHLLDMLRDDANDDKSLLLPSDQRLVNMLKQEQEVYRQIGNILRGKQLIPTPEEYEELQGKNDGEELLSLINDSSRNKHKRSQKLSMQLSMEVLRDMLRAQTSMKQNKSLNKLANLGK